jgi:membrane-associated protease RseP (regulator of RpoE activity)
VASSQQPSGPGGTDILAGSPPGRSEQRAALIRLALVLAVSLVLAQMVGVLDTVLVVLALLVMVVLHELGHFLMAKRAGMKVSEFFVGFGPRLWAVQRGETTYGIKALPLGGYCKIVGMTGMEQLEPADEPRAYRNQPAWRQLTVVLAGSFVHFLLAFIMLVIMFAGPGDIGNYVTDPPATNPVTTVISLVGARSPAQLAGLRAGDRIVAVNGRHFASWDQMSGYMRARPGLRVMLTVERAGRVFVTPPVVLANGARAVIQGETKPLYKQPAGLLGVSISPVVRYGLVGSVRHAGTAFGATVAVSVRNISRVVTDLGNYMNMLRDQKAADSPTAVRFVSPVGIVRLAHKAAQIGLSEVLYLLILINIFVGLFNLVPMLPMDGGYVAIALYEKARSWQTKQPYHSDISKLAPAAYLLMAVLVFYAVSSLFLDLRDLLF